MSRPSRYGPKPQTQTNTFDKNGPNGTDAAAAVGLNKARAQFNEPIVQLQAIFPDWKEEDLISVLEEVKGDVELAVARISEGHAEQWGAVKHKKEKKQPAVAGGHRERGGERERVDRDHTSPRGTSSPRGRGRAGGQRGAGPHSGASRSQPHQHRDRTTNGSSVIPVGSPNADLAWPAAATSAKDLTPEATAPDGWGLTTSAETGEDQWATTPPATHPEDIEAPSEIKQEESVEPTQTAPLPSHDQKPTHTSTPGAAKAQRKPGSSGRSWADIAKPTKKPPPVQNIPAPAPIEPPSATPVAQDTVPEAPEPTREEPTTVEAPTWDDEPAVTQPPATQPLPEQPTTTDGWVDANPTSAKSERTESWTDLGDPEQRSDSASRKNTTGPAPSTESVAPAQQHQQEPQLQVPQVQQPTPSSFSPPPGLANPALPTSSAPPKPATPSNSRPAFGVHRPSSRFKTDQAVIMPPSSQGAVAGFAISKTLPLQFGSLDLSGDNGEPQPSDETTAPDRQLHATEQKQAYGNGQTPSANPMTTSVADTLQTSQSQPSVSPRSAYRTQGQQQPQQEESTAAASPNVLGGPVHTQAAPSVNPLAMAPGPGTAFAPHQHHPVASHHTLSNLSHTPHHSGPQALGHSHHPSFGQQGSFPPQQQQQQYEGAAASVGGTPFSGLGQSPQGQSQFFRQTDSPFYNQSHTPLAEHGFSGGSAGGFGQGMQTSFNGGPGLGSEFGYDGQRNPYDNYPSQSAFVGRGALRPDDVKGLGSSPGQGLSAHHGSAQPSPLTGQPSGGQGQGQYPGMGHMGNTFYYNMNMNPYGYANSFYPPAFTSFPMYQAGAQTPPHGAKPGGNMNASVGLGASGNSTYSATNSGHLQHTSGGFDGDNGPNGTSTYHSGNSALPGDFQKGPYTGAQNFLGAMGAASGGVGANRGPGNVAGAASGGVGSTASPETAFKGYGGSAASNLGPAEKSLPTQAGRGAPGVNPGGHQQLYQNNRYSNVPQGQGYPQQQQQQQQGDSYYSNYHQRW